MAFNSTIAQVIYDSNYTRMLPELVTKNLGNNLLNLAIYVLGMVLYTIVIWHFYRHLSKKTIFSLDIPEYGYVKFLKKISTHSGFHSTTLPFTINF